MDLLLLLVNVAGAATLLLWAVRMVRTGIERLNGNAFRRAIQRSNSNRVKAAFVGTLIAVFLQSSTAVAVLVTGLASSGIVGFTPGMSLLLGADLGSALVVQLLSYNLSWLTPFLLLIGGTLFLKGRTSQLRQAGRIIIGIGFILLSLRLLGEATEPLSDSGFLVVAMGYLTKDLIASFLIGIVVTWLLHSSVATVLLVATLVAQSVVPAPVGYALILGANIGAGLIAFGLTRGQIAVGRRIPVGNLVFRTLAAIAALVALNKLAIPIAPTASESALWMVYAHVMFNALLLLICLPLVGLMGKFTQRLLPSAVEASTQADTLLDRESALDRSVLRVPQLALASATRECLRMSDIIELMLQPVMTLYERSDKESMRNVRELETRVNTLHSNIKLYLVELNDDNLNEVDVSRKRELTNFAINMEAIGDLVTKNLLNLAERKNRDALSFSSQGWNELTDLHKQVVANMHLALNVLVSGDLSSARQLIEEKDRMRAQERNSNEQHLRRLQSGASTSIETSDIHIDTLRVLRQINSLFATNAYPILSRHGELLDSRLAKVST